AAALVTMAGLQLNLFAGLHSKDATNEPSTSGPRHASGGEGTPLRGLGAWSETAAPAPDAGRVEIPPGDAPGDQAVEFVRMHRARRYILRLRPGGILRVTIPRGGSRREATRLVGKYADWIRKQRARISAADATRWVPDGTIWLRGEAVPIVVSEDAGRPIVRYAERTVRLRGGVADLRRAIETDLRRLARVELGCRLEELAALHGLKVAGISIRNQRSRWGSCSRHGRIALNYRLLQMPPAISDYVLLHELMHLREQNHSRRFWRQVAQVCPAFREAERWLKTEGRALF
ncbi:MAG: SprT family zinc-dependent metalloprotease, partial [Acidobacteriota bacterium]